MRVLLLIIIGLLSVKGFSSKPNYVVHGLSDHFKCAYLNKTSKSLEQTVKNKVVRKTRIAEVKYKRSKIKGLKASQFLASETTPLKTLEYIHPEHEFIQVVYTSFLYCVKYKRGPPLS